LWDLLYVRRQKRLLKEARYLVSISPYFSRITEGMTSATVFDIPNPVDSACFELDNNVVAGRLLYIGGVLRRKNLLTLIRAIRLIRREMRAFRLVVAGKVCDYAYFREIKQFVSRNDLQDNVAFLGMISNARKLEEFSKMSFLVLPSFQETAPCVIGESFAAGKPAIASDVGGIPCMMDEERNGLLVDPNNERELADKVLYLLENPQEAKLMGRRAREYARRCHALEEVVSRYKKAFEFVYDNL